MRQKLSVLLAFALVFTLLMPAFSFAATPDTEGTKYQSSVEMLMALGIVNGYTDGSFRPDNAITRAEFAKMAVIATGGESLAMLLAGEKGNFKDVPASAWYNGYVNAAVAKGLIVGFNDGTFRPNDKVTYAQVLTVLLRSLGYKDQFLPGSWPANFLAKAADLGMLDNVTFTANASATRGNVAILTDEALNQNLVVYKDGNEQVTENQLISKVGSEKTYVLSAPKLNKDGELSFVGEKAMKAASKLYIAGGKTLSDLLGHEVKVFKDKKGVVVALVDAQSADHMIKGTLKNTVTNNVYVEVSNGDEKAYPVLDNAVYYYNGSEVNKTDLVGDADVTVYLDKDTKARFVVAYKYDVVDKQITSIIKGYDRTTITAGSGGDAKTFYGTANTTVTLNGKAATLDDLQKGDVLRVQYKKSSVEASMIDATRQVVEGRVVKKNTANKTVDIDGTTYQYVGVDLSVGTVYALYLNADGKIVAATSKSAAQSGDIILTGKDTYAVLDGNKVLTVQEVKGMTFDGKEVTLTLGTLETGSVEYKDLKNGKVYNYTVTDGKVTAIVEKTTNGNDIENVTYDKNTGAVKGSKGEEFYVTSETKLAFIKKDDKGNVVGAETATVSDLAGSTVQYVALKDKKGDTVKIAEKAVAQYVLITKAAPAQTLTGIYYGMDEVYEDGKVVKYVELFNGTDKQKVKVTVSADAYKPGDLVSFSGTGYDTVKGANTKGKDKISVGSYSVTFGNQTYYFSAGAKIVLTIFDSKGNFVDVVPVSLSQLSAYADGTTELNYQAFTDSNFIQFLAVKVTQ